MSLRAIDLFCGAGGLSLGLANAGIEVACAVDNWSVAANTYSANFDHPVLAADISDLTAADILDFGGTPGGDVDVVVGGPPCQGFSVQRIGSDLDARNSLVLEFARLVLEFRPKMFLMENVPGLLGRRGGPLAEAFDRTLSASGYRVRSIRLNVCEYGVPQSRRRVMFYGWPEGEREFDFPAPTHGADDYLTVWDAIGDLPSPPADCTPLAGDPLHRRTRLSPLNLKRLQHIPPGGGMVDLPVDLRVACHRNGADRIGHRYVYGRLAPDKPSATITARFDSFTRGRFGHPYENRNITLREGARLQSFPDRFEFIGNQEPIAALIGNAVPPTLATLVARQIVGTLEEPRTLRVEGVDESPPVALQQLRLPDVPVSG